MNSLIMRTLIVFILDLTNIGGMATVTSIGIEFYLARGGGGGGGGGSWGIYRYR